MATIQPMRRALPVRSLLIAIAAVAALPTLLLCGLLLWQLANNELSRASYELEESAKGIAQLVDGELAVVETALRTLASAPSFAEDDLAVIDESLRRRTEDTARTFVLVDAEGRVLVDTSVPRGASLPRIGETFWQPVLDTRRPHLTDVVRDDVTGEAMAWLSVPVLRQATVKWILASRVFSRNFADVLAAPGVPPNWIVSITDRHGVHIARSHRNEQYAGQPMVPALVEHVKARRTGSLFNTSLDGIPLRTTAAYASKGGWAVAVGFPVNEFEAPYRETLLRFVFVVAIVLGLSLLIVFILSQRLSGALQTLSHTAMSIGAGNPVAAPLSRVREIDEVGGVLEDVSSKLHAATSNLEKQVEARTRELSRANAKLLDEMRGRAESEAQVRQLQKMEAIGQLTGGIAHDFNNMLAIVLGSLRLLQRRLDRGESNVQKYIDAALQGAERAAKLTSRLLAFARQQPLAPEIIDVGRTVAGMGEILRSTIPETIEIETVLAGGLWRTNVDPQGLESVIINLAVNARDAMPQGGHLTIETANTYLDEAYCAAHAEATPGQYVMIALTDTGVGMTAEIAARAFDPFFTTKATGDGTGLGLSQVYGFIKQSGGHVKLYSEPDQGTTVKLYLPRHFGDRETQVDQTSAGLPVSANSETILIVEDEPDVRKLTVEMVRELGYATYDASGGLDALDELERHPEIALVVTDVVMPGMNGRQLADAIKMRRPDLPVLFTTGYTRNAIVHGGILDPGVHLLTKPHTIESLALKIDQLLRQSRATNVAAS